MRIGVLALQGAFHAHQTRLRAIGVEAPTVRTLDDLDGLDGIVLPGGESTTMSRLLQTSGLHEPLGDAIGAGLPVFGTCAGMILCATTVLDGRPDQVGFGRIDLTVRRNGYGRQLQSFETDLDVVGLDAPSGDAPSGDDPSHHDPFHHDPFHHDPFHAVFIRAPKVVAVGAGVEVLAEHDGVPVLVREGTCTVASFHPELTADVRLHRMFVESI